MHNSVDVLNTTELQLKNGSNDKFDVIYLLVTIYKQNRPQSPHLGEDMEDTDAKAKIWELPFCWGE